MFHVKFKIFFSTCDVAQKLETQCRQALYKVFVRLLLERVVEIAASYSITYFHWRIKTVEVVTQFAVVTPVKNKIKVVG